MHSIRLILVCFFAVAFASEKCRELGQTCDRTIFNKCCDGIYCVLKKIGDGTCEKCLPKGHFCFNDAECCSGNCAWYRFCK